MKRTYDKAMNDTFDSTQQSTSEPRLHSAAGKSKFRKEYSNEFKEITSSKKGDGFFYCTLCDVHLVIGKMGSGAIRKHIDGVKHKEAVKSKEKMAPMEMFVTAQTRIPQDVRFKAMIAEAVWAYHTVKHHQSFLSVDCVSETFSKMFTDSSIVKEFKMGRKKATAIIKNVIYPLFKKKN